MEIHLDTVKPVNEMNWKKLFTKKILAVERKIIRSSGCECARGAVSGKRFQPRLISNETGKGFFAGVTARS